MKIMIVLLLTLFFCCQRSERACTVYPGTGKAN
ncbi:Uncharacterised protein [Citrobacter freundii]|nr:Uncharacterised protein [Citrobacter freundii]